jgi:hypothetical protein
MMLRKRSTPEYIKLLLCSRAFHRFATVPPVYSGGVREEKGGVAELKKGCKLAVPFENKQGILGVFGLVALCVIGGVEMEGWNCEWNLVGRREGEGEKVTTHLNIYTMCLVFMY